MNLVAAFLFYLFLCITDHCDATFLIRARTKCCCSNSVSLQRSWKLWLIIEDSEHWCWDQYGRFCKRVKKKKPKSSPNLAVVSSQVKIDSLGCTPVPPAVTRCERHPDDSPPVPRSEPALLIVPSPTHRLVLLALGDPAFPREAEDVGVAAEDGTMFHGSQHPYWVTRLVSRAVEEASWSRYT